MSRSFSQELEDLLNPLPKFADPEDDPDEATRARVIEQFSEDDEVGVSDLRKQSSCLTDTRYVGRPVSRKQLLMDGEDSEEEEEDDNSEEDDQVEDDETADLDDDDDDDLVEDEEDEEEQDFLETGSQPDAKPTSQGSDTTLSKEVDFYKMTKGMDDLGVSEDDDDDDDDDDDEELEGSNEDKGSEDDEMDEGTVRAFSQDKVDKEVEKGQAVKNQLFLWDQLLEGRIKLQKALMTANQLPQPQTFHQFKERGGTEFAVALKNPHKALKALQRSLLELHDHLLYQNPDTKAIAVGKQQDGSEDEEINSDENDEEDMSMQKAGAPKRKLDMAEYPGFMAKRFAAFQPYRNATLQRWHDKTRLTVGKTNKGFGAFERNIVTQVEQVLMDNERLVRRTQTQRSEYRILGTQTASADSPENVPAGGESAEQFKANAHLKDLDEDIFDDDDFYHQLLRELIERKTSAADPNDQVAMGRQWLAIQKLRSKIKKKVDTKASKGRKVRFHVHSKLVNFMAPMDHSSMSDETRSKLYQSLFGQNTSIRN